MKSIARLLALMLAVMLCVVSALAEEVTPDTVVATVNGEAVTLGEVEVITQNLVDNYAQYGYDTTNPAFLASAKQYALEYAVQLKVMELKAVELGFDQITDEERAEIAAENAKQWADLVEQFTTYYGGVNEDSTEEEKTAARANVLSMLEAMGYTEAVMLEGTLENLKYEKVETVMVAGVAVTDEDVQAAYEERVKADEEKYADDVFNYEYMTQYMGEASYYMPAGYRGVTHILLNVDEDLLENYQTLNARLEEQVDKAENPTAENQEEETAEEEPVTQAQVDAAYQAILDSVQPTIDEINQKLAAGADFASLVEEYGNDPGMTMEPNKSEGYSVHMDSVIWDPAFVKGAFSVNNVGEVAAPVVGSYGVHIIYYLRDVPAGAIPLTDDLRAELNESLLAEKESEQFDKTMDAWMSEATITYTEAGLTIQNAADEPAEDEAAE